MAMNTETKQTNKKLINIKLPWCWEVCVTKENSTLRQANLYQHEEMEKNRQGKLI